MPVTGASSHFARFKGMKAAVTQPKKLTQTYMEQMVVRQPQLKHENLHPDAKRKWNQMTQAPLPLKYKLHELEAFEPANKMEDILKMKAFRPLNEPLGVIDKLPFEVERTSTGNLPVYTDFRAGGNRSVTVVRKIFGDVDEFKDELSKVVSNSPIEEKMGRLEVSGLHTQKVKVWLSRLGF